MSTLIAALHRVIANKSRFSIDDIIDQWTRLDSDTFQTYDRSGQSHERNDLFNDWLKYQPKYHGEIYRAIGVSQEEWEKLYDVYDIDQIVTIPNKESYTKDRSRASTYGSGKIKLIFILQSKSGVDISDISYYPQEKEVDI